MATVNHRSRSLRRVTRKTPGGKVVVHHVRRKPSHAKCAMTGEVLKGVPRARPADVRKLAKSSRRPSRPYGGVLSSRAMRIVLKDKARKL